MRQTFLWLGKTPENVICSHFIKDLKLDLKHDPLERMIRIQFGSQKVYCRLDSDYKLVCENRRIPIVTACLRVGVEKKNLLVAGWDYCDSADGTEYQKEWRGMYFDRREEPEKARNWF